MGLKLLDTGERERESWAIVHDLEGKVFTAAILIWNDDPKSKIESCL